MVIHGIICENMWPRHLSQKIFSWFGREDGQCLTGNLFGHMTSLHTIISQNERGKQNKNCDEIPKVMPLIITLLLIAPLKKNI